MLTARTCRAAGLRQTWNVTNHRLQSSSLAPARHTSHYRPTCSVSSSAPFLRPSASRLPSATRTAPRSSAAFFARSRDGALRQPAYVSTAATSLLFSRLQSLLTTCRRHASSTPDKRDAPPAHPEQPNTNQAETDRLTGATSPVDAADADSPPPPGTVPAATVGNLDAEIGEAMAVTGADLSTPAQSTTASSPTSSFTQSEDMLAALEIRSDGSHIEKQYSRLQLARRFGLHPRDLRFLDSSLRNLPSLLVRREVIIVNLELFKAIISATEVLMFDPWYPHIQSIVPLMKHALQAFHRANDGTADRATSGGQDGKVGEGGVEKGGDKSATTSDVFRLAFDYVSSFDSQPPVLDYTSPYPPSSSTTSSSPTPPSSKQQSTQPSSSSSSSSSSPSSVSPPPPPAASTQSASHSAPASPTSSHSTSSFTAAPSDAPPLEGGEPPHLPPHSGSSPSHPSLRHLAADLESTLRDRTLYGLHESEKEYEEWIEPRMPFEFIALELILMTVTRTLESRFEVYNSSLSPLLSSSSTTLNEGSTLMHLLQLKNGLTSFEVVLGETGWALRHVLQDDADMAEMFLTMKAKGQVPRIEEHDDIEVLLETYLRKVDELENEVRTSVKSISLTEEHIQIRLDTVRNAMMKVDLLLTICTFALAASALVASTFGMNLSSHLEKSDSAFYVASAVMVAMSALLIRFGLKLCKRHKIDLFHAEPDEPKLRLPMNGLRKHKHRLPGATQQQPASRAGKGGGKDAWKRGAGFYDRDEWVSQSLEDKLRKLEEMKDRQQKHMREKQERIERELKEKQDWIQQEQERVREKEGSPGKWQQKDLDRHRAHRS